MRKWAGPALPPYHKTIYSPTNPKHASPPLAEPTIVRAVAIRSRPFSGPWNSGCARILAEVRRDLVEFHAEQAVRSPHARRADRNPQHRILVATILRRMREWSDGASALSPNDPASGRSKPARDSDQSSVKRILVATVLRHMRKWAEDALRHCCQRIHLPIGPGFRGAACLCRRPSSVPSQSGRDHPAANGGPAAP